jgi:hypothetical protein
LNANIFFLPLLLGLHDNVGVRVGPAKSLRKVKICTYTVYRYISSVNMCNAGVPVPFLFY